MTKSKQIMEEVDNWYLGQFSIFYSFLPEKSFQLVPCREAKTNIEIEIYRNT